MGGGWLLLPSCRFGWDSRICNKLPCDSAGALYCCWRKGSTERMPEETGQVRVSARTIARAWSPTHMVGCRTGLQLSPAGLPKQVARLNHRIYWGPERGNGRVLTKGCRQDAALLTDWCMSQCRYQRWHHLAGHHVMVCSWGGAETVSGGKTSELWSWTVQAACPSDMRIL